MGGGTDVVLLTCCLQPTLPTPIDQALRLREPEVGFELLEPESQVYYLWGCPNQQPFGRVLTGLLEVILASWWPGEDIGFGRRYSQTELGLNPESSSD